MAEQQERAAGLTRREMLERTAWVTGATAVAWATPGITTMAHASLGAPGSPVTGTLSASHIGFVVEYDSKQWKLKFDFGGGNASPIDASGQVRGSWSFGSENLPACSRVGLTGADGSTLGFNVWRNDITGAFGYGSNDKPSSIAEVSITIDDQDVLFELTSVGDAAGASFTHVAFGRRGNECRSDLASFEGTDNRTIRLAGIFTPDS